MNQTCKVCGEPAAGFHFGAFTCEGCKSFFGRSYNNQASINDCKNNGKCTINKQNRTACKACRLRKCRNVGMSKSGSRYGRRSNWFKIHCLLQEQQQQQAAVTGGQGGPQNTTQSPQMNMLRHSPYPHNIHHRPYTREELLSRFEDYTPPSATPSVSSPDSHNSESSVEIGERRNSMIRHAIPSLDGILPPNLNKDLFLPLSFPGLSMSPHGFLPHPHILLPNYHSALYAQHPNLLQPVLHGQSMMTESQQHHLAAVAVAAASASSAIPGNNNSRFVPNHNNLKNEEDSKQYLLNSVLKSSHWSPANTKPQPDRAEADLQKIPPAQVEENGSENEEELVVSMTPPRSSSSSPASANATKCPSVASCTSINDIPIDLSMKTGSTCSWDGRTVSPSGSSSHPEDVERTSRRSSSVLSDNTDNDGDEYIHDRKRIKLEPTLQSAALKPVVALDLTNAK